MFCGSFVAYLREVALLKDNEVYHTAVARIY